MRYSDGAMPGVTPTGDERLVRAIGLPTLAANIINMTIGAGIFVLPAVAARGLGPAAPLAYIVCALLMGLIVACFAAAGSRVSLTGGLYAYIEVAFGPFVGFLAGVLFWLMAVFAVASVSNAFAGSVAALLPAMGGPVARATLLAAGFGALAMINVLGVRSGARVVQVVTTAKLLPLAVFLAAGLPSVHGEALRWTATPTVGAIGQTRGFSEARQREEFLRFRVAQVAKLVEVKLLQRTVGHWAPPLAMCRELDL